MPGCSFQWGETLYKIALFPLGGYVKMVGEGAEEEESADDPRSFKKKSVGQRMAIISAGVIMNVIFAFVVVHFHHTDGAYIDDRERDNRLLAEDEHVERIAILTIRARDEAVIRGIHDGAVEHPIEPQQARGFIDLVLVLAAQRHFDDNRKVLADASIVNRIVVPWMHQK